MKKYDLFHYTQNKVIKVKKQFTATKYAFVKQKQKHPLKQNFWTKQKHDARDDCNAPSVMYLNYQKKIVFFGVLFIKESLFWSALKQMISDP